jgi:hypothetical protein
MVSFNYEPGFLRGGSEETAYWGTMGYFLHRCVWNGKDIRVSEVSNLHISKREWMSEISVLSFNTKLHLKFVASGNNLDMLLLE